MRSADNSRAYAGDPERGDVTDRPGVLASALVGESNAAHFAWLSEAILRNRLLFKDLSGATIFAIGEQVVTPPIRTLIGVLGGRVTVQCFDLYAGDSTI